MKKVALSLIALLAVGTFGFAEDASPEKAAAVTSTLTAYGRAKFGVDLDRMQTGYNTNAEFDLNLNFVPEADASKTGTGDIYGSIVIEDVSIALDNEEGTGDDDGTADASTTDPINGSTTDKGVYAHNEFLSVGTITAKVNFPNGYLQVYSSDDQAGAGTGKDPKVSFGQDGDDDNSGATIVDDDTFYTYYNTYSTTTGKLIKRYGSQKTEWTLGTIASYSSFTGTGVRAYYALPSLVGFTVDHASKGTWETNRNEYETALTVGLLAVDKLTFNVKGYLGSEKDADGKGIARQAAGLEAAYDLGVVTPFVHVNAKKDLDGDTEDGEWVADAGAKIAPVDGFKAVLVGKTDSKSNIDVVFTSDLAANKLAGPVGALLGVKLVHLTSTVKEDAGKTTEVFYKVSYDVGGGVGVWTKGSFANTGVKKTDSLYLKAGVDAAVFPLVTLGAEYDSNNLGGWAKENAKAFDIDNETLGQFFVYAKVAY